MDALVDFHFALCRGLNFKMVQSKYSKEYIQLIILNFEYFLLDYNIFIF